MTKKKERNMRECEIKYFCNWCFACSNEKKPKTKRENLSTKNKKNAEKESRMSYDYEENVLVFGFH